MAKRKYPKDPEKLREYLRVEANGRSKKELIADNDYGLYLKMLRSKNSDLIQQEPKCKSMKTCIFPYFFNMLDKLDNMISYVYSEDCRTLDRDLADKIADLWISGKNINKIAKELHKGKSTIELYLNPQFRERRRSICKIYSEKYYASSILYMWSENEIKNGVYLTEADLKKRGLLGNPNTRLGDFISLGIIVSEVEGRVKKYKVNTDNPYSIIMAGLDDKLDKE